MPQQKVRCEEDKLTLLDMFVNGYLLELHVIDSCLSQSWYYLKKATGAPAVATPDTDKKTPPVRATAASVAAG